MVFNYDLLLEKLKEKNLSIRKFAKLIGTTEGAIRALKKPRKYTVIYKIANYLDMDVRDLFK